MFVLLPRIYSQTSMPYTSSYIWAIHCQSCVALKYIYKMVNLKIKILKCHIFKISNLTSKKNLVKNQDSPQKNSKMWSYLSIDNWVPRSGMLLYLHHRNSKLFLHPAKFDNFKDEKISDFKTVSVSQSKNVLDWKLVV